MRTVFRATIIYKHHVSHSFDPLTASGDKDTLQNRLIRAQSESDLIGRLANGQLTDSKKQSLDSNRQRSDSKQKLDNKHPKIPEKNAPKVLTEKVHKPSEKSAKQTAQQKLESKQSDYQHKLQQHHKEQQQQLLHIQQQKHKQQQQKLFDAEAQTPGVYQNYLLHIKHTVRYFMAF